MEEDVTPYVDYEINDGEFLPITRCVCGERFGYCDFVIYVYSDDPVECPKCRRKFYFRQTIRVYEVK